MTEAEALSLAKAIMDKESNKEVNLTQERLNLILDLKDMVNAHSKTINKMAKVINSLKQQVDKLEVERLKTNTNIEFGDIFRNK